MKAQFTNQLHREIVSEAVNSGCIPDPKDVIYSPLDFLTAQHPVDERRELIKQLYVRNVELFRPSSWEHAAETSIRAADTILTKLKEETK